MDELFLWLDAARTSAGNVLLVLTHADKVPIQAKRLAVSTAFKSVLVTSSMPFLRVLSERVTTLFALHWTTNGDYKIQVTYRDKLQELCATAPRLQDCASCHAALL